MILHIVLFQPGENLTDDDRAQLLLDIRRAAAAIPSIRRFRIGARVRHGLPGYEQATPEDYSFAAIIEFDDRTGLAEYLRHPSHQSIGAHFTSTAKRALAYDYVVEDVPLSTEGTEGTDLHGGTGANGD
jgi:hypothetical protein